ncbi:hypothetical protein V2J09_013747 [Rumex salicifolius]
MGFFRYKITRAYEYHPEEREIERERERLGLACVGISVGVLEEISASSDALCPRLGFFLLSTIPLSLQPPTQNPDSEEAYGLIQETGELHG